MFASRAIRMMSMRPMARTMATKAAAPVKVPVQLFGLDGTYATALYTAAAKESDLSKTEGSLAKLRDVFAQQPEVAQIVSNPTLSHEDKQTVVNVLSQAVGGDKTLTNFLTVISDNNRLALIPGIIEKFETLVNASKGLVEATVTSASELDKKTVNRIQAAIAGSSFVGEGELKLNLKVNPDILGGLIVEVAERTVDVSVASKIARLNHVLSEPI
ncbi:OSCP/delta subunit of ATPase [Yarrowia lipolytica]|uniref:ATP synthase subunit 5, mitochondrial n=2 Tax=Yarrowia lipolytica TaxID=4952 RepID=ATPO_YARLI|nr:YALI0D12584p [Yarrowia lipolytica CLIB122]Q6C9B1.2 RecName: Full=ATP synthase subunit 5, mitochondrial; Short=ATP synthase chain 5; AltName: Full=Oligomycin sensitivity conferral protein; Short=OSCP; Flags: Precursor [Yarrowia lipolytica CLIB122]AOW03978.1 hypothetical protein YALI1_D15734g [Yarrowia lipolytica]KAB8285195.1 OSCP/delta subunit of ATPase [Yarrowia lipolytica]KAE8171241.1 OSCP/delta subunit of ATPase [Yarrowia lipolytica]KAJ8054459.1 OSCP/delta subunit of ATPase [Yarrowia lipo|eukprot:XP_502751.2 YALI0D12584p [Yarrowia lipolytica CLIB122]